MASVNDVFSTDRLFFGGFTVVTLIILFLFIPHTLLSSPEDTPNIFYRYLVIISGSALCLENVIITCQGIDSSLPDQLKRLCTSLDCLYILITLPLLIPFINNIINTSNTAQFLFRIKMGNLVAENSEYADPDQPEIHCGIRILKLCVAASTFTVWVLVIFCQSMAWLTGQAYYMAIILNYAVNGYFAVISLFLSIAFSVLFVQYRELQKRVLKIQRRNKAESPRHHSVDQTSQLQAISRGKCKVLINELLALGLAALSIYSLSTIYPTEQPMLKLDYLEHPLFHNRRDYALSMSIKISCILILYLWLSKDHLYRHIPPDSIGFMIYNHCCCGCRVFTLCAPKIHPLRRERSHSANELEHQYGNDQNHSVTGQQSECADTNEVNEAIAGTTATDSMLKNTKTRSVRFSSVLRRNSDGKTISTPLDSPDLEQRSECEQQYDSQYPNAPQIHMTISKESQLSVDTKSNPSSPSERSVIEKRTTTSSMMPRPNSAMNTIRTMATITGFDNFESEMVILHDDERDQRDILSPDMGPHREHYKNETATSCISIQVGQYSDPNTERGHYHMATDSGRVFSDRMIMSDGARTRTSSKFLVSAHHTANNTMSNTDVSPGQSWYEQQGPSLPTYNEQIHGGRGLVVDFQSPTFPAKMQSLGAISDVHEETPRGRGGSTKQDFRSAHSMTDLLMSSTNSLFEEMMMSGVKCIIYLIDVMMIDAQDEAQLTRMQMHFEAMQDAESVSHILVISEKHNGQEMAKILGNLEMSESIKNGNIIGYDHEWVSECKHNLQSMVLQVIKHLEVENDEVLFIGNLRHNKALDSINVCQTYAVDAIRNHTQLSLTDTPNSRLKGEHFMFLESQIQ